MALRMQCAESANSSPGNLYFSFVSTPFGKTAVLAIHVEPSLAFFAIQLSMCVRESAELLCLSACLAINRRCSAREHHYFFACERADVVMQAHYFGTRDFSNHLLPERPGCFD